jgi:hypothetical protein
MPETGTSGSVGALGEQSPGATQPRRYEPRGTGDLPPSGHSVHLSLRLGAFAFHALQCKIGLTQRRNGAKAKE